MESIWANLDEFFAQLSDADWQRPHGNPWNHFMEARIRFKPSLNAPDPAITTIALNVWLSFLSLIYDAQAGQGKSFTARLSVQGDGGGDWGYIIDNGEMQLVAARPSSPDLTLTYENADAFAKQNFAIEPMESLIQSGAIKIDNMAALGTFATLFPPLSPETVVTY